MSADPNCKLCFGTGFTPPTDKKGNVDFSFSIDYKEVCPCTQQPKQPPNLGFIQDIIDIEENSTHSEKYNGLW